MAENSAPWIEKYRPLRIDHISHQEVAKKTLRTIVETNTMPHLLFFGPPGTGKTTAVLALARELYGDGWRKRIKELNASDDRGIKAVREKVKTFAEQLPAQLPVKADGTNVPDFKIIVLDEADMMTVDAQSCLRRVMEDYAQHTRFVLICNYVTNIISPIQSRCASYRFEPVARDAQIERLKMIGSNEGINMGIEAMNQLVTRSDGDMRLAITTLYTLHCAGAANAMSESDIDIMMGFPDRCVVQRVFDAMMGSSMSDINTMVEEVVADGWDLELLFKSLAETMIISNKFNDVQKAILCQILASGQSALMNGVREFTALMSASLEINNASNMIH